MNRLSIIRGHGHSPNVDPKTDISSLPLELHAEILSSLGHWIHYLVASQVCRAWRELLKKHRDPSVYYQEVYVVTPQPRLFNSRSRLPGRTFGDGRHLLFQECSIAYRRCPITKERQIKLAPTKDLGFYDDHALCYFPTRAERPKFYDFNYFSLLSHKIATDGESRPYKINPSCVLGFRQMCLKRKIPMLDDNNEYMVLGAVLDLILDTYKQCFEFSCTSCANKFDAKNQRRYHLNGDEKYDGIDTESWDFGDWEKAGYEEFAKQCNEFGVIIQEQEKHSRPGLIFLRVCPGDSWAW
ncbi:hypothetical protein TWF730_006261 [Orbilia blumenaviensis]|uniref:F-box domain-containing protein n=1 Tax=Orbilia blumenaviensis TaxID=1796055 RepID=A0AAV9VGA2_9PEZI